MLFRSILTVRQLDELAVEVRGVRTRRTTAREARVPEIDQAVLDRDVDLVVGVNRCDLRAVGGIVMHRPAGGTEGLRADGEAGAEYECHGYRGQRDLASARSGLFHSCVLHQSDGMSATPFT